MVFSVYLSSYIIFLNLLQVPCNKLEGEDQTKKLLDSLLTVRPTSIPRWNEHKDVKEDKEREPFFFQSQKQPSK